MTATPKETQKKRAESGPTKRVKEEASKKEVFAG
jgi:hypothetical protein